MTRETDENMRRLELLLDSMPDGGRAMLVRIFNTAGVKGRVSQQPESVFPRDLNTAFALPAQFVEADRREGADERKASSERAEERYDVVAEIRAAPSKIDKSSPMVRTILMHGVAPQCAVN